MAAKDVLNVKYKEHIKMTLHMLLYGKTKYIAKFRAFKCCA